MLLYIGFTVLHNHCVSYTTAMFQVFMEIVAVDSAIYSVVLSMVICMVAVLLFTRHFLLLLIIFISITGGYYVLCV